MDRDDALEARLTRMGGYRMQHRVVAAPLAPPPVTSHLCEALLMLTGWGLISANLAGYLARKGLEDGIENNDLSKLGTVGTSGDHKQNSRRDLLRRFCKKMSVPKPMSLTVRMKDKALKVSPHDLSILSPFELISSIYQHWNALFPQVFGTDRLREFWRQVKPGDPRLSSMGDLMRLPNWQEKVVPIVVHGDGAPFNKRGQLSLISLQWRPLLALDFMWLFPFFMLVSSARANQGEETDTFRQATKMAAHLLNFCRTGVFGSQDPWLRDWPMNSRQDDLKHTFLCEGRFHVVRWLLTGDSDWFGNYLRFPHHATNHLPCWLCPANRLDPLCLVSDCAPGARFKSMLHGVHDDDNANPPVSTHEIMEITGASRHHNHGDWQHAVDLGALAYFLASVLVCFLQNCYTGTLNTRLQHMWKDIHQKYIDMNINPANRMSNLTLKMFYNTSSFPLLHAKAAESAALLHVLHEMSFALRRPLELKDDVQHRALCHLVKCDNLVRKSGDFLNDSDARSLLSATEDFLLCQNWLLKHALREKKMLYPWTIKYHFMWHIAYLSRYGSPRLAWCYPFEDFMGRLVISAKASMAGTSQPMLGNKVMANFLLVLELYLRRRWKLEVVE